jgi:transposase
VFDKKRKGRPSPLTSKANELIREMFYNRGMSYKEIQEHFKSHGQDIGIDALRKRCKRYDTRKLKS